MGEQKEHNERIIRVEWRAHRRRLAREKLLVSRICALPDKHQVRVLVYIEELGLELDVAPNPRK